MKKIKASAHYGFVNSDRETILKVDDDATPNEIDDLVWEWATSYIDSTWGEVEND